MITIKCTVCNKEFGIERKRVGKAKYCSYTCCYKDKEKTYIFTQCMFCKRDIQKENSKRNREAKNLFCSSKCYLEFKTTNSNKSQCNYCSQIFSTSKLKRTIYCSSLCQYKATHIRTKCLVCQKEFITTLGKQKKYCSKECQRRSISSDTQFRCVVCGEIFVKKRWERRDLSHVYCSRECYNKRAPRILRKCECGNEFLAYQSRIGYYNKLYCSRECYHKYSNTTVIYFGHIDQKYTKLSRTIRSTAIYNLWRKNCLKKNDFKCVECLETKNLTVHHKVPMWKFFQKHNFNSIEILKDRELFDPNIGETLCRSCHRKKHERR